MKRKGLMLSLKVGDMTPLLHKAGLQRKISKRNKYKKFPPIFDELINTFETVLLKIAKKKSKFISWV